MSGRAPQAVIFVGVQGSGKSSHYARCYADSHVRINLDMLRTRHRESALLHACLCVQQSFVVDNTNPTAQARARYVSLAKAAGYEVEAVVFEVPVELALARNARREGKARVPDRAIHGTLAKLEPVGPTKASIASPGSRSTPNPTRTSTMTDKTALGDRMKLYERAEAGRRFMPRVPICARIDGKRFSKWTRGLARPYDPRLSELMVAVTIDLVEQTQAVIGYTQSDEISLVLFADDPKHQLFLDGRIQKLTSILASMTTAAFNHGARIPERADEPALFDCRCWMVPTREEAINTLLWRERDASKNSLSMAARHYYPHAELDGLQSQELHERLHEVGVNWNDYPPFFKRGTFVRREIVRRPFDASEFESLPALHEARRNPELVIERAVVRAIDMPPFDKVENRVAVVFEGASPELATANG